MQPDWLSGLAAPPLGSQGQSWLSCQICLVWPLEKTHTGVPLWRLRAEDHDSHNTCVQTGTCDSAWCVICRVLESLTEHTAHLSFHILSNSCFSVFHTDTIVVWKKCSDSMFQCHVCLHSTLSTEITLVKPSNHHAIMAPCLIHQSIHSGSSSQFPPLFIWLCISLGNCSLQ